MKLLDIKILLENGASPKSIHEMHGFTIQCPLCDHEAFKPREGATEFTKHEWDTTRIELENRTLEKGETIKIVPLGIR